MEIIQYTKRMATWNMAVKSAKVAKAAIRTYWSMEQMIDRVGCGLDVEFFGTVRK